MKRFLGVRKRTLSAGIETDDKTGADHGYRFNTIPTSGVSVQSKEDKLVMLMNQAGMKMQELRNIINQEAVLARKEPDTLKLQAFVLHYTREIERVDAICNSDSNGRRKEGYHCFADDLLQSFNLNRSNIESEVRYKTSQETGDGKEVAEEHKGVDSIAEVPADSTTPILCDGITNNSENMREAILASSPEGQDVVDKLPQRCDHEVDSNSLMTGHKSQLKHIQSWIRNEERDGKSPSREREFLHDGECFEDSKTEEFQKKHLPVRMDPESTVFLSDDSQQDIIDASLKVYKNKVRRRPTKKWNRLSQIFPLAPDSTVEPLTSTPEPSPSVLRADVPHCDALSRSSVEDNLLASGGGDSDGAAPWKTQSKSRNESWYEFKERCSRTSLHNRTPRSSSPVGNVCQMRPFRIQDYVDAMEAPKSRTPPVKCVRFNLSPQETVSDVTSQESSSDEDAPFEVDQFPCAKPKYNQKIRRLN